MEGNGRIRTMPYHHSSLKRLAMQGWERAINTPSVRRPQPHNTNPQNERRERDKSKGKGKRAIEFMLFVIYNHIAYVRKPRVSYNGLALWLL